jgi:NADPH:quinone reductase-like Zn-dependent oxidoreductase
MKAFTLDALGTPPALRDDLPEPAPGVGEVLVRVQASSANPVDNAIAAGMLSGMVEHEFPVTLGRDYAGVVEAVGDGVTGFAPGDEVYGFLTHADPAVHAGAWAERIVVPEDRSVAPAPVGVGLAAAGAAPLAGITALAAVDALELSEGATVLIVGATGGVGSFAVQLAAQRGATVVAPALPEDAEYLRGLGVAELTQRDGDVVAAVRERHPDGVDALLDLVSYAPGAFDAALAEGGRVASPLGAAGDGPGRSNVMAQPSRENLDRLAGLLADATAVVPIQATYGLDRAGEALQDLAGEHTQGKLAIRG